MNPPFARIARRARSCGPLLALLLLLAASPASAGDEPFVFPSNIGLTGLLETPTARVLRENRYRLGATEARPYRFYYGAIGLFDRLEVAGRITEVFSAPVPDNPAATKNYKDKAVDIKLQILPEGKYAPALALVVLDPHGTRLYTSQAIVASKQIFPFDFSLGFGNGRYGRRPLSDSRKEFGAELFTRPGQWLKDAQPFGGIQFAPGESFALLAEYSPIRYERQTSDFAQPKYFRERVPSPFNFGVRWKPFRWAEIDASWQRGNRFAVGASVAFDIGKPLLPVYDTPWKDRPGRRSAPPASRIEEGLAESGFSDIGVADDGLTLRIEAQNDRYYFTPRAVEVILGVLAQAMPPYVEYIRITIKENGIPVAEFVTTVNGLSNLSSGEIDRERFLSISSFRPDPDPPGISPTVNRRRLVFGAKPSLETFLNDPAGYVKFRFGLIGWIEAMPWEGGSAILGAEAYPVNTASPSAEPLSIPVRSDLALYKKEKGTLGRLLFEQIGKTRGPVYGKISAGLLETEYAGFDGEAAAPFFRGRLLAGVGASAVQKRDPHAPFRLKAGERYHTLFLNTRLNVPEHNVHLDVKAGRFLAGDKGARITVSKFINGVVLSAWYGVTDTSVFSDSVNRGYRDKGISVDIPIRLFLGRDSKTSYRYAISPWTRDVAQDVDHHRTLFDLIGRNAGVCLDKDGENLYKGAR